MGGVRSRRRQSVRRHSAILPPFLIGCQETGALPECWHYPGYLTMDRDEAG